MVNIPDNVVVFVDGSSYLFRAYHALPPLTNSDGVPTGAIFGVINMLKRLIAKYSPNQIAVVFDSPGNNFRHKIYPEYKANRSEMPEDLKVQIDPLYKIIKALGLPLIIQEGVEADDVLGTMARRSEQLGFFTIISTGDKDLSQLVNENTILVNTMTDKLLDEDAVFEKFSVHPNQIIDYLTLVGDSVDNIPGVPKVGPKTAAKWLSQYNDLDSIIKNSESFKGKIGENLRGAIDALPTYKKLTTIKCDLNIDIDYSSLVLGEPDIEQLKSIYTDLNFSSWVTMLENGKTGIHEKIIEKKDSSAPINVKHEPKSQNIEDFSYIIIDKADDFDVFLKKLKLSSAVAFDVETTSLKVLEAKIVGISFMFDDQAPTYIPLAHIAEDREQLSLNYVLDELKEFFSNDSTKILHNAKYDLGVLKNYSISVRGEIFDTMLASYVLNSVNRHDLDNLSLQLLNIKKQTYSELVGSGRNKIKNFESVDIESAASYSASDSYCTYHIYQIFNEELRSIPSLLNVFKNIEMPLMPVLLTMETTGVRVDSKLLLTISEEIETEIVRIENLCIELAGEEFNLNSVKQLQDIMYKKMGLPVIKKTPKGVPSTREEVLQELSGTYEFPKLILEYRSLTKLKSTYTDKLPLEVNSYTSKIHTSYHQAVTSTGRLSSSDPNIQNIPVKSTLGAKIRSAFIPTDGYKILSCDYSQIELRIMAHLSKDPSLLKAFNNGEDVHAATASEIFSVEINKVTKDQRRTAKAVNFGLIYGMTEYGLSRQLNIDVAQSKEYLAKYFNKFPRVLDYMDEVRDKASSQGYIETMFGRRLYLPDIASKNNSIRNSSLRAAINAPMQGAQADIIKLAMIKIHKLLISSNFNTKMIMQVHDELVFDLAFDEDHIIDKIIKIMETVVELDVPIIVDTSLSGSWQ